MSIYTLFYTASMNDAETGNLPVHFVSKDEQETVKDLAMELSFRYNGVEDPRFLVNARSIAYKKLPLPIIHAVNNFFLRDMGMLKGKEALLLKGLYDTSLLPKTPNTWEEKDATAADATSPMEFIQALILSLHWHPVSFEEQRGGGLAHDLIANPKHANEQVGTGSLTDLFIHTEDVPLNNSADVMSLFTIRNEEGAESILSFVQDWELSKELKDELMKPQFIFPPDPNLLRKGVMYDTSLKPILFGSEDNPCVRLAAIDIFDNDVELNPIAMDSLKKVDRISRENAIRFKMDAGDFLLFSNRRALHGRGAFEPLHDLGVKRWVIRMMAVEGLGKSREFRSSENPWKILERSIR